MIIKELYLGHFGKFHDNHVSLTPGLNIVYGHNEAGKSTMHAFIRGMLFGIEKSRGRVSKEDLYTKYEPWDTLGAYHGSMVVSIDGEDYRINRSFYKKERRLQVISVRTGREVATTEGELQNLLKGLTESVYCNTISVEQLKAKTEQELADELKKYITNLSMSKSAEVDVTHALSYLTDKKKQLEKSIPNDQLKQLQDAIANQEDVLNRYEQMKVELEALEEHLNQVTKKQLKYSDISSKEKLAKLAMGPAIEEKYQSYKETVIQLAQANERFENLTERTQRQSNELDSSEEIQKHLAELHELRQEKQKYEEEVTRKKIELGEGHKPSKINAKMLGTINVLLGILLCLLPVGNAILRTTIGVIIVFVGVLQCIYRANRDEHNLKRIEEAEKEFEKEIFYLHSKRHDILLSHRVANETQLVLKFNEVAKLELEREQFKERKTEYLSQIKELKEKKERLEFDIVNYMKYFIYRPEACDSCMEELRTVTVEFYEEMTKGEAKYQARAEEIKNQMERIRWTLESHYDQEEQLRKDKEEFEQLTKKKQELLREIEAIALSIQTLKELASCIHDTFGARLNEVVSETIAKISNGEYQEVTVDENLNLRVLQKNRYVTLDNLSVGTMDQMYLALRLAVAQLLFPEEKLPVILDDAFAFYDEDRTREALLLLAEQFKRQIILFTCHNREKEIIEKEGFPANIIELG